MFTVLPTINVTKFTRVTYAYQLNTWLSRADSQYITINRLLKILRTSPKEFWRGAYSQKTVNKKLQMIRRSEQTGMFVAFLNINRVNKSDDLFVLLHLIL